MLKKFVVTGAIILALTGASWASVVVLKNGDRVTGDVVDTGTDSVAIKSESFGEITVNRERIDTVLTGDEAQAQADEDRKKKEAAEKEAVEAAAKAQAAVAVAKAWSHKLSVGYNSTNGNTKTSAANVTLDSHYKNGRDEWNVKNSLDYASDKGRMTTQKFYSKAESDSRLKEGSKWFNRRSIELNHDKFANIDYRILPSIGLGYWFWEGDVSKSEFDLGIGYEYTNFNTTDTKSTGNFALIPHYYVDRVILGKAKISEDLTVYPSLDSFADFRLRSESSFVNPISDKLSLKLSFIDDYNSAPKGNAKKNDTTLMSSVQYAF